MAQDQRKQRTKRSGSPSGLTAAVETMNEQSLKVFLWMEGRRRNSMATVVVPSMMRDLTDGAEFVTVEGSTLKEVVDDLDRRCPGMKDRLIGEDGKLQPHIAFFVDGVEVKGRHGLLASVSESAEIVIVPALSGGSGRALRL